MQHNLNTFSCILLKNIILKQESSEIFYRIIMRQMQELYYSLYSQNVTLFQLNFLYLIYYGKISKTISHVSILKMKRIFRLSNILHILIFLFINEQADPFTHLTKKEMYFSSLKHDYING